MSWLNSWSEGINKRMCRFLLHRYLGQLLRDKLCLEQLTVDVFNGTGKIDELMLDVEWINGQLSQLRSASPNMPRFKLVDGYIGSLAVHIPWQNLLATSCTLTVDRLEVTIAVDAHADQIVDEIQAASLVDSLVGSMASSVQLAKSILSETDSLGDQVDGAADRDSAAEGVEAFAQIIEAVLARLHVTVNDIIVRLESAEESTAESLLATAVEIRVDKCSFVDEQMDKLSSVGQGNCENLGTQPTHTLHSVEGLSKLLYLHGVRLYTDSFTRPSYSEVLEDNGAICTSMYIRRKKEKSNVDDPQMLENHQSIFSSSQFVSCYSHISNNAKNSEIVMSQPILVASLGSEKQTVRFRLKNEKLYASQGQNVQIDIQLFLGTLYSIVSPSQINIVTRLISEFLPDFNATSGGKKYHDMSVAKEKVMDLKDFSKIEEMLLQAASTDDNLHQRGTGKLRLGADNESVSGGGTSQIQIRAKLACVLVKALCREPEHRDVMQQLSDQFHQAVNKLEWTNLSKTNDRNSSLSDACQLPHLSLYLSPLALEILSEELCDPNAAKLNKNSLFCAKISSARAAMSEFHYSSGSECSNELAESQLLVFDDADSEQGMDACLQCELSRNANIAKTITNSEAYSIRVDLAPCKIEIDMSIVDRISQLLDAPFLKQSKMASFDANPFTMACLFVVGLDRSAPVSNSLALSDDIFTCDKTTSDGQSAEFDLSVKCAKMTVDYRIPAADLTPISSPQDVEARRCVHREILRFQFDAAKVHMAAGQGQQLNTNGCVAVHANRIIGWLRSATSDGAYDSLPVLQAANECSLSIHWDVRDKSLRLARSQIHTEENLDEFQNLDYRGEQNPMQKSMWASYFAQTNSDNLVNSGKVKGPNPFTRKVHVYDGEMLTLPGTSGEHSEFKNDCLAACQLHISLEMDKVHLLVPDKKFYEILYNRLANDLALWQPLSTRLAECQKSNATELDPADLADMDSQYYYSIHANVNGKMFAPCRDENDHENDAAVDGSRIDASHYNGFDGKRAPKKTISVVYFELNAKNGTAVLYSPAIEPSCGPQQVSIMGSDLNVSVHSDASKCDQDNGAAVAVAVTFDAVHLAQSQLGDRFETDVTCGTFGYITQKQGVISSRDAEKCLKITPVEKNLSHLLSGAAERSDNGLNAPALSVAVTLNLDKESNTKSIRVALAIRNSLCHISVDDFALSQCDDGRKIWLAQIIDLFDETSNSQVAGYTWPRVITELHVHLDDIHLQFHPKMSQIGSDPSGTCGDGVESPCVRVGVDSAHFSSRLVPHSDTLTLRCVLEDSRVYVSKDVHHTNLKVAHVTPSPMKSCIGQSSSQSGRKSPGTSVIKSVHFDKLDIGQDGGLSASGPNSWTRLYHLNSLAVSRNFVCIAHMGLLDLRIILGPLVLANSADDLESNFQILDESQALLLDIMISNDQLSVAACSDAIHSLGQILNSSLEHLKTLEISKSAPADLNPQEGPSQCSESIPDNTAKVVENENARKVDTQVEERLKVMVQSAMRDQPYTDTAIVIHPSSSGDAANADAQEVDAQILNDLIGNVSCNVDNSVEKAKSVSESSKDSLDSEFCIVDEIPGSGITCPSGQPRVRCLLPENDRKIDINWSHFTANGDPCSSARDNFQINNVINKLPRLRGYARPLVRYTLSDFSAVLSLYGGSDFVSKPEIPPYSQWARSNPLGRTDNVKTSDERDNARHSHKCRDVQAGGLGRDKSVLVDLNATKLSISYEMYAPSAKCPNSPLSRCLITLADLEVRNHLKVSKLKKIVHQYCTDTTPRRTCAPIFCIKWLESKDSEYKVKVCALPLRINLDQDTLEFLQDYFTSISTHLSGGFDQDQNTGPSPDFRPARTQYQDPVMQIPPAEGAVDENQMEQVISELETCQESGDVDLGSSVITVAGLFDSLPQDTTSSIELTTSTNSVRFRKSPSIDSASGTAKCGTAEDESTAKGSSADVLQSQKSVALMLNRVGDDLGCPVYISSFTFCPSMRIRLDYSGSIRFSGRSGSSLHQLLMGLAKINCAELILKQLEYRHGILGAEKLIKWVVNQWLTDIAKCQLPQVVGSLGPLSALAHILRGVHSLFTIPANEWRSTHAGDPSSQRWSGAGDSQPAAGGDGPLQSRNLRLARAVRKGALTFGNSTATGLLELVQNLLAVIQGAAELALDIVSPEFARLPMHQQRNLLASVYAPADMRQGLDMASAALRQGVWDAAQLLQVAAQEDRARGRLPLRGVLRLATPAALRPLVLAGRATGHLLAGVHAQLQPDKDYP